MRSAEPARPCLPRATSLDLVCSAPSEPCVRCRHPRWSQVARLFRVDEQPAHRCSNGEERRPDQSAGPSLTFGNHESETHSHSTANLARPCSRCWRKQTGGPSCEIHRKLTRRKLCAGTARLRPRENQQQRFCTARPAKPSTRKTAVAAKQAQLPPVHNGPRAIPQRSVIHPLSARPPDNRLS